MSGTLQLKVVRETKDLTKFLATVLPEDLRDVLRFVAQDQLTEQRSIGRPASAIIVDGTTRPIYGAMKRVQLFFSDNAQLAEALHEAFDLLKQLTRNKTGSARGSYRLFLNERDVGDEGVVDRVAAKMTTRDKATIVGPMVEYGRKLAYAPATGGSIPQISKRKAGSKKSRPKQTLHSVAQRVLTRKYRALTIKEAWISTPFFATVGKDRDASTPGLMIRFKAGRQV